MRIIGVVVSLASVEGSAADALVGRSTAYRVASRPASMSRARRVTRTGYGSAAQARMEA
jgi:hypothetical protein